MIKAVMFVALAALAVPAQAKVDPEQAARLGQDLTPLGAERAANAAGSIPEWTGGITTPPPGYSVGMHHLDPYATDQPLFVINQQNLEQYSAQLPVGIQELVKRNPDYYVQVFPSRRSASAPQRIYAATRANAEQAQLISGGNGVQGAAAGIPFPLPQNGVEVIWNHIMRYRGEQMSSMVNHAAVLSNGSYSLVKRKRDVYFVYGRAGMTEQELNNTLFYYKYRVLAPASVAGSSLVVEETLDQILALRKAWRFSRAERRVRRLPTLAYDSLQPETNGMATADVVDAYNGAPDRYEWQLLGKREMLVPYNSYAVHQEGIPYSEILHDKTLNPKLLRHELHRVWVVEANLRIGFRHPYAKRRFYIDEDSWQVLAVDLYDKDGQLIGLQESHPINYYDVLSFASTLETIYDFKDSRYFVDGLDNNEPMYDFNVSLSPRDFTPQALRRER